MKRISPVIFLIIIFLLVGNAHAELIVYENWNDEYYSTPSNMMEIAALDGSAFQGGGLNGNYAYVWGINDVNLGLTDVKINIVFHNIYQSYPLNDLLKIYLFDNSDTSNEIRLVPASIGLTTYPDYEDYADPWSYNPTSLIAAWSDPTDNAAYKYDLIYTLDSAASIIQGGASSFVIGIDPDCIYKFERVTVDVPIPEPATLLLLGSGLVGLGAYGRRRFLKKR